MSVYQDWLVLRSTYSSPAWLKTLSDGADVAVMLKSSRAELDN